MAHYKVVAKTADGKQRVIRLTSDNFDARVAKSLCKKLSLTYISYIPYVPKRFTKDSKNLGD